MKEICPGLFIGDMEDYHKASGLAILSATQTIHYKRLGWDRKTVDKTHPDYLYWVGGKRMTLNWVDGAARYYALGGSESFSKALKFISGNLPCLIHCNRGESRSASLGLLYLAREGFIPSETYRDAKRQFLKIYPKFNPGGIENYISDHWNLLKEC